MPKKKTKSGALIYLVLDESGSMSAIRDATIEGVNTFLKETKVADPQALVSLLLFNHSVRQVHSAVPLADIEDLHHTAYRPSGNTALLDAIGYAISDIEKMEKVPEKVVVAVLTDGVENASTEYTRAAITASVSDYETKQGWQFLFLGANLDSFAEAGAIGVRRSNSSLNWQTNSVGTRAVYAVASAATSDYLMGSTSTLDVNQATYDSMIGNDNSTLTVDQKVNRRARGIPTKPDTTTTTP